MKIIKTDASEMIVLASDASGCIVHVNDASVKSGINEHLYLLCCGIVAEARKSKAQRRRNHFAHTHLTVSCKFAKEIEVRHLIKHLLEKHMIIRLPKLIMVNKVARFESERVVFTEIKGVEWIEYPIASVLLEKYHHQHIPDVVCRIGKRELLIEVNDRGVLLKKDTLIQLKTPCIQVNVAGWQNAEALERCIFSTGFNYQWVYDAKVQKIHQVHAYWQSKIQAFQEYYYWKPPVSDEPVITKSAFFSKRATF